MHLCWGQNKNLVWEGFFLVEGDKKIPLFHPPVGKTLIQLHTVYCVAVEIFNSGCESVLNIMMMKLLI